MSYQFSGQIELPGASTGALDGQFGFRIKRSTGTVLQLIPWSRTSWWQGSQIPGTTYNFTTSTTNGVQQDGTSDGVLVNANVSTLLYVYWCGAGDFAGGMGISTFAPQFSDSTGLYTLDVGGAGSSCLFIGWIYLDAAGNMTDTQSSRLVCNYWNRLPTRLALLPGYNDNGAGTTFALNTANWAKLNGGTGDTALWIANGENDISAAARFTLGGAAPAAVVQVGIGDDSAVTPHAAASFAQLAAAGSSTGCTIAISGRTSGLRTIYLLGMTGGLATTFQADQARNGSAEDPCMTGLEGIVWA
jgi:hypothetical protein